MAVKKQMFKKHENDTGSVSAQIGLLTDEIKMLQEHVAKNSKDYDAKRSLLKKVAKRRTFLKFIKARDLESYSTISKKISVKV